MQDDIASRVSQPRLTKRIDDLATFGASDEGA